MAVRGACRHAVPLRPLDVVITLLAGGGPGIVLCWAVPAGASGRSPTVPLPIQVVSFFPGSEPSGERNPE